jgi:hypothetical protein
MPSALPFPDIARVFVCVCVRACVCVRVCVCACVCVCECDVAARTHFTETAAPHAPPRARIHRLFSRCGTLRLLSSACSSRFQYLSATSSDSAMWNSSCEDAQHRTM